MSDKDCGCCGGTGNVLDIVGEPRPCSRCRWGEFTAWYRAKTAAAHAQQEAERKARKVGKK